MKRLLLIFFSLNMWAQNSALDLQKGFNGIEVGTHYNLFLGLPNEPNLEEQKVYLYKPLNEELQFIYGEKIEFFKLTFDSEGFLNNFVVFCPYDKNLNDPELKEKFRIILEKLIAEYGEPDDIFDEIIGCGWEGTKLNLAFVLVSEDENSSSMQLIYNSK